MQVWFNRIFSFFMLCCVLFLFSGCHAEAVHDSFIDELTFLGDSTTAHMQQRSSLRPEQIWATKERYLNLDPRITYTRIVAPDTGKEEPIAEVAARLSPRYLVLTLGVDYGVYYYRDKPLEFRHYYEKLLDVICEASPETVLVLQAIFPVSRESTVITNEMIKKANAIIQEIAATRNLCFADQTAILSDADGYLKPSYCYSADGIHLSSAAYAAILDHLKSIESEIRRT